MSCFSLSHYLSSLSRLDHPTVGKMNIDDDWTHNGIINHDCFISSAAASSDCDIGLQLSSFDQIETYNPDKLISIKMEPDETSDYHGSSSGSPSSSLSSPHNIKDEPLALDINFGGPFTNTNFSPAQSSESPIFMMHSGQISQQHSPLPPVGNFSHSHMPSPQALIPSMQHYNAMHLGPLHNHHSNNSMLNNSMYYEGIGGLGLAAAQQQLKSRSKMHEMAVKQKLITDQVSGRNNTQSNGDVQLSAEERKTLIQEGYSIPSRLPLTKNEEEALKIVRRKIKNKLSAQESRRKRKEYLDALEIRVQGCVQENNFLKSRIRQLEQQNRDLIAKVQSYEDGHNAIMMNVCKQ